MINIKELIFDSDFSQLVTIIRYAGEYSDTGLFDVVSGNVVMSAVVNQPSPTEIQMLPEQDRFSKIITLCTHEQLYQTAPNIADVDTGQRSDELDYNGNRYKIVQVFDYSDYGYWKSIAVSKNGYN